MKTRKEVAEDLRRLRELSGAFGEEQAASRRRLIERLRRARFGDAASLVAFHEALLFARAYPDDPQTLALADDVLGAFGRRRDVAALHDELWDSGLQGAGIWYQFYWETARWLAARWPDRLVLDWESFRNRDRLKALLPLLVTYSETPGLDEYDEELETWFEELSGPDTTDAAFLVRRIDALRVDDFQKEMLSDEVDAPMKLLPGEGTPCRSTERWRGATIHYQRAPLDRRRPDLRAAVRVPPEAVREVSGAAARELVDLTRGAMVTRSRDLDAFCYSDARDVRLVECGDGLCFALLGVRPERRLMTEAVYGMLTLKNGVPAGYVLISALFDSAAIAFNVFDTFRGGEAAHVLGRALSVAHHLFGATSFSIDPYQLGHGNAEGLSSGAWWFYQKLGFRPADDGVRALMERELRRMQRRPGYRSDLATMEELVVDHMHLHLGRERADTVGQVRLGEVGCAASALLARRFGADRERGVEVCAREARRLLGAGPTAAWTDGERLWWDRWAPVLLCLRGVERWSPAEKRAAVEVVRSKGSRRESDFVERLDGHPKLRRALLRLTNRA